jgi:hypothetical protein
MKQQSKEKTSKAPDLPEFESNPFNVIMKGWEWLFRYNRTPAIMLLVVSFLSGFSQLGSFRPPPEQQTPSATPGAFVFEPRVFLTIAMFILGILLIVLFFAVIINGILSYIAWKTSRQETTTFTEAFRAVMGKFWIIAGVYVLSFLKIAGGLLLFIVPGIRAALRYKLVTFPVFEENLKGSAALTRIKALSDRHLMEIFGITALASIIPFVSLPLETGSEAVLYRQLKDLHVSGAKAPKTHWLNYVVAIFTVTLLLIIITITFEAATRTAAG